MNHISARATILELILLVAKSLASLPDHVSVEFEVSEDITLFKIDLHKDDHSNFLGKAGSRMRALRILVEGIAQTSDIKVVLILCE